jgi:hypothetical protein
MSCGSFENEERTQLSLKLPWPGMAGHRAQPHAALAQQLLLITHWTKVLMEGVSQTCYTNELLMNETNERKEERKNREGLAWFALVCGSFALSSGKKSGK